VKIVKTADFHRCVEMIAKADRICIVGSMASGCLASCLGYLLAKVFHPVDVLQGQGAMASSVCNNLTQNSLVFLIAFPRYPKETMELGHLAAQKGSKIIAITNNTISPIAPLANLSFGDVYAAPMTFLTSLVIELNERNPEKSHRALKKFDEYASQTDLLVKLGVCYIPPELKKEF